MKIVFVGGGSALAGSLLDSLKRERHEIFWISPEKPSQTPNFDAKCTHFPFKADDTGIEYILTSIGAEAVIYLGAFDDSLNFSEGGKGGQRMMGELSSLLLVSKRCRVAKFILLSSDEVYGEGMPGLLCEADEPTPLTTRGAFLSSAEKLLGVLSIGSEMRMLVARIGSLFGPQTSQRGKPDYILAMCLAARKTGQIEASPDMVRRPIFCEDALSALRSLVEMPDLADGIYHIAGNAEISDYDAAKIVASLIPNTALVESSRKAALCLSGEKTALAVGHTVPRDIKDAIAQTVRWSQRLAHAQTDEPSEAQKPDKKTTPREVIRRLWDILRPYLENFLLFALAAFLTIRLGNNPQFGIIDYFMVYVVVVGAILGKFQSAIAALFATAMHLYIQTDGRSIFAVTLQYGQFFYTGVLFTLGMMAGYVRDQFTTERQEHQDDAARHAQEYSELLSINDANMGIKNALEQRLLGYGDSFAKIVSIISELDMMEPQRVLHAAVGVIQRLMNSEDVAIYMVASNGYFARLAAASSTKARSFGKSIRLENYPAITAAISVGEPFVNRQMAEDYPLMAAPILVGSKVTYIIMLIGIEFDNLSPYSINLLSVVARLVSSSADRAYRYAQALRTEQYLPETDILSADAFAQMVETLQEASDRGISDYTLLCIDSEIAQQSDLRDLSSRLTSILRDSDAVGLDDDGNLLLLLTNTSENDAVYVIQRLQNAEIPVKKVMA
jgi:nucleoside-diphosphate-sugar epimerase